MSEWLLEGRFWRELNDPGPGSEVPTGAQGMGKLTVSVSERQRKWESNYHHRDREEEEEDGGDEQQPFFTTAEF